MFSPTINTSLPQNHKLYPAVLLATCFGGVGGEWLVFAVAFMKESLVSVVKFRSAM
jgi:hypothetical protein